MARVHRWAYGRPTMRNPIHALRELRMPADERRAAKSEREAEQQMRKERDSERHAERMAARTAGESQRYKNQGFGGGP